MLTITDNIDDLGFLLKTNPTGGSNVVLKSKTYYQGQESEIAVAYFQIRMSGLRIDNIDSNK